MNLPRLTLISVAVAVFMLWLQLRYPAPEIVSPQQRLADTTTTQTPAADCRAADQTFLTFPEWFLVYSPKEYAELIAERSPSEFPYLEHIGQFWQGYRAVSEATKDEPFNGRYHEMIFVIGASTSFEYGLKWFYETTVGRVAELTSRPPTEEDRLAAKVAKDYVDFLDVEPWYRFDFVTPLRRVWTEPWRGPNLLRKWERKYFLTTEYSAKVIYAWMIKRSTESAYGIQTSLTTVVVDHLPSPIPAELSGLKARETLADGHVLLDLPRYQALTAQAELLARHQINFVEIAGNRGPILVSAIVPTEFDESGMTILAKQLILTQERKQRVLMTVPIADLSTRLRTLNQSGIHVEHVYDF
ncbi:MAG TPA: hypothetical protein VK137_06415 [Planctomycetaceae bacterium]|nr:hypothetical protein [Planctomycetaceae bacterium]